MTERLIIFTRYPEPGTTKTRLIPALGAEGAAALQRQMTEHTLEQVQQLRDRPLSLEIRFTGGNTPAETATKQQLMQGWLGDDLSYHSQATGDLGARMAQAFQAAFRDGLEHVVTIGTDCPSVDAEILTQAFEALRHHDLVLGPATDGGYYLIGLSRFTPELFEGIRWGTDEVLQRTVEIAERLGLAVAYLMPLTDIDRPEDLPVWEDICAKKSPTLHQDRTESLSIIIPVLNEAHQIQDLLLHLRSLPNLEIIVVDGGSRDQTVDRAKAAGVKVILSLPGRANQMNAGAQVATGETLLFLHADTRLPPDFQALVHQTLAKTGTIAGAFELKIDGEIPSLRWVEWGVRWRSRLCQLPYGDQALFLKAATFKQVGGFPELPIMEDFVLVRQLRKLGRVAIAPATVITSGRRWQKLGVWHTTLLNQLVIVGYYLGISPQRLAQWYRSGGRSLADWKATQKPK